MSEPVISALFMSLDSAGNVYVAANGAGTSGGGILELNVGAGTISVVAGSENSGVTTNYGLKAAWIGEPVAPW